MGHMHGGEQSYDGEMYPQAGQDHPKPGPHASTQDANEDAKYPAEAGQVASSEFSDAQDFGTGLDHDPDALDRHPKTHKSAGM